MKGSWPVSVACVFAALGTAAIAQTEEVRFVRSAVVNLRSGPGQQANAVGRLPINTRVTVTERRSDWCAVRTFETPSAQGWVLCSLLAEQGVAEGDLASAFERTVKPYDELVQVRETPDGKRSEAADRLLRDPQELLAVLERRYYAAPSIDNLAWYGTVAEDVAYLYLTGGRDTGGGDPRPGPAGGIVPKLPWLGPAKATWRGMVEHFERGWRPGARWPRMEPAYRYEAVSGDRWARYLKEEPNDHRLLDLLPKAAPSFFAQDDDLFVLAGDPFAERQRKRGAPAGQVTYGTELSDARHPPQNAPGLPRSYAGDGFRIVANATEFLKQFDTAPRMRLLSSGSYSTDGLLGINGVELTFPSEVPVYALTETGATRAVRVHIATRGSHRCGVSRIVGIDMPRPLDSRPIAFVAAARPFDAGRTKATRLAARTITSKQGTGTYSVWSVDVDGDGAADVFVVTGLIPNIVDGGDQGLLNNVFANVGGVWKVVSSAQYQGCT